MKQQLLLATNNLHKGEEIKTILSSIPIEILTLKDIGTEIEVIEDCNTLEENALKKAREIFTITQIPSLADDTGLEVFALNNAPGVYSARYAGAKATYEENCRKLLSAMKNIQEENRRAQFRAITAFVAYNFEKTTEGICAGKIISSQKGTSGFGYDPVFLPEHSQKTFAELSSNEKNIISHRGRALQKMKIILEQYYQL
jgi:XTP/dITP diphosphohydrolase